MGDVGSGAFGVVDVGVCAQADWANKLAKAVAPRPRLDAAQKARRDDI